jgi:hypothetical protein
MALSHSPSIVTDGLVLYLDAANPKSYPGTGTGWFDLTRSNITGTFVNGPTFNSSNQGNIIFDGTDDIINTTYVSSSVFTWSAWFKTDVVSSGYKNIISIPSPNYMLMLLDASTANLGFWSSDALGGTNLSTPTISINTWYNAVFVREGNSVTGGYKAYVNAVLYGNANTGTWSSSSILSLGGRTDVSQFLDGNIAQVSIYNRVLSAAEILQNFNAMRGRFGI